MGLLRSIVGVFLSGPGDFPRHESQGPTPDESASAESAGYKWDDRCGFYQEGDSSENTAESSSSSSEPEQCPACQHGPGQPGCIC